MHELRTGGRQLAAEIQVNELMPEIVQNRNTIKYLKQANDKLARQMRTASESAAAAAEREADAVEQLRQLQGQRHGHDVQMQQPAIDATFDPEIPEANVAGATGSLTTGVAPQPPPAMASQRIVDDTRHGVTNMELVEVAEVSPVLEAERQSRWNKVRNAVRPASGSWSDKCGDILDMHRNRVTDQEDWGQSLQHDFDAIQLDFAGLRGEHEALKLQCLSLQQHKDAADEQLRQVRQGLKQLTSDLGAIANAFAPLQIDDKEQEHAAEWVPDSTWERGLKSGSAALRPVLMRAKLAMDYRIAGDVGSGQRARFEQDLVAELARAAGVPPESFLVKNLFPGSIVAEIEVSQVSAAGPDPRHVVADLEQQASDAGSLLRNGRLMSSVQHIAEVIVDPCGVRVRA